MAGVTPEGTVLCEEALLGGWKAKMANQPAKEKSKDPTLNRQPLAGSKHRTRTSLSLSLSLPPSKSFPVFENPLKTRLKIECQSVLLLGL